MSQPGRADPPGFDFRLLGPLEVWRDGHLVRLGGERQRGLLASLLLHPNEVVTTDQLVEELFGGESATGAVNALRVAISRIRRRLEGDLVVTQPRGYLLCAEPEQLDVTRFERLFDDGRSALARGDPAAAAARLRDALALWRGPPLSDLSSLDFLAPEIRRLEGLRLAALMERIEADLTLGREAELIAELEALVALHPLQERLRGQLMLALYRDGRQADALAVYRGTSKLLGDELGLEPSRSLQQLERSILQHAASLDAPVSPADSVSVCPFMGLAYFDRDDAAYFCGREPVVADLVTRVSAMTCVGIVGPSGVGKSSILRAGLLGALSAGALPRSEHWRLLVVRPGARPCAELERALGTPDAEVALARLPAGERLVLAIDQLEEVFTACEDETEREAFFATLVDVALDPARRGVVVVTLRADFYGRCAGHRGFAGLLSRDHVLVGPMNHDELVRAIELPVARSGLQIERALVDQLVADIIDVPGGLPLLSTALLELWQARDGSSLRFDSYRATGGVRGAVARLAESAYTQLDETERRLARAILLRLAAGDAEAVVGRRAALAELEGIDGSQRVLRVLIDARLLTTGDDAVEVSHDALLREWPRLRSWLEEDRAGRRLHVHLAASASEWDSRGRDPTDLYRGARLTAALDWTQQHAPALNALEREFVGESRAHAERELRGQRAQNRRLRGLVAGVSLLFALAAAAGAVALVKGKSASRAARVALARQLGAQAVIEPRIDRAMLLAREAVDLERSRQTESTLLATLLRSPAALATFTVPIDVRPVKLAISPDGGTLVVTDNHNQLRFYDTRHRKEQRPPLAGFVATYPPSYTRHGSRLFALTFRDGRLALELVDAGTLATLQTLRSPPRADYEVAAGRALVPFGISDDQRNAFFAYAIWHARGGEGSAFVVHYDLRTGATRKLPLGGDGLLGAAYVDEGRELVTVTDTEITTWDARTLRRLHRAPVRIPPGTLVNATAISPDGRRIAYALADGTVIGADALTGAPLPYTGNQGAVGDFVTFSPSGRLLVSTAADGTVIVWNPATGRALQRIAGHGGRITAAAITGDDQTLYTTSLDGSILEWDLGRSRRFGRPFTVLPGAPRLPADGIPQTPPLAVAPDGSRFAVRRGRAGVAVVSARTLRVQRAFAITPDNQVVTALDWSPTGSTLAVTALAGRVELWDVGAHPHRVRALNALESPARPVRTVQAVAFSADGRLVAAVDLAQGPGNGPADGRLAIWRTGSGALVASPVRLGQPGLAVAFASDDARVAVALDDGSVLITHSRRSGARRLLHPLGGPVHALAFGPDGMLTTGSWGGIIQRWNPFTGAQLGRPALVAASPVASLSLNPSGDTLAEVGGSDVKLWAIDTLQQLGSGFPGSQDAWGNARYMPDGRSLVAVYADGTGYLWPTTPDVWATHACAVAGRNLTGQEWARYVPDHRYAPTCP